MLSRVWRFLSAHPKSMTLALAAFAVLALASSNPGTMYHG